MSHSEASWRAHPGRNPKHHFGGYRRKVMVKIPNPLTPGTFLEREVIGRPRNPSRWLPHQGGASTGPRPAADVAPIEKVTRQQKRRHFIKTMKKVLAETKREKTRATLKASRRKG